MVGQKSGNNIMRYPPSSQCQIVTECRPSTILDMWITISYSQVAMADLIHAMRGSVVFFQQQISSFMSAYFRQ